MKYPNLLSDALYNIKSDSGASIEYSRGLIVGVVSTLMAVTGMTYEQAVAVVAGSLPIAFSSSKLPKAFRDDIISQIGREV